MIPGDSDILPGDESGVALRFSGQQVTARFRDFFDELWDSIPDEQKGSETVVAWLEAQLEKIGKPV